MDNMDNRIKELSNEELSQVSAGGGTEGATFLCEYEPDILLYRSSSGMYLLVDTSTGKERFVEDARDLDDAAYELKKLRQPT